MQRIRKIGIISLAKIMAVIYGLFGVLMGLFVVISKILGIEATGEGAQLQAAGYAAIIIFPLLYALIGAVSGLVSGYFFNLAVNWVGPLELKIVQTQE